MSRIFIILFTKDVLASRISVGRYQRWVEEKIAENWALPETR